MKYKKVLLPPEPYYSGRVTRYPDRKVAFEAGLRWHGSYEISYIKKGKVRLNKLDCEIILNAGDVYVLNSQEVHSYEDIGEDTQADDFDCAKSAIRYMHDNYKHEITLNEIANYVGMTPAHFSKYFKDKTDETFSKYLRRVRLEHAIDDLRNKKITVRQAAIENGFPNVNSFILFCKSEYGRTPAELRNYSEKN